MDEAIDASTRLRLTQRSASTDNDPKPMHIFDIRRSNSVTELWKKFELDSQSPVLQSSGVDEAGQKSENTASSPHDAENTVNTDHQHSSALAETSQPLLAAFEEELARLLDSSYISNEGDYARHDSSASAGQHQTTSSDRQQSPTDSFAQALHHLVNGARSLSSDVRSRIPDFEQQFRDVQRAIPDHVESTLQSALTAMESLVRNMSDALNNAATARAQRSNNSSPGGVAASTVNGLRTMASELGEMRQTLFEAFEAELACNTPADQGQGHGENTHESSQSERQTQAGPGNEAPTGGSGSASGTQQSGPNVPFDDEKEILDPNKVKEEPSDRNTGHPSGNEDAGFSAQPRQPEHTFQTPVFPRPGPHYRPHVDPPHVAPHPFGPHPFYIPPPRHHHMIPHHHAPPPVPSFQTHPIHNSLWQHRHPHHPPWSRVPHHPPPSPPRSRPWHSGWPPVSRPDSYNQPATASTSGTSQSATDQTAKKTLFIGNVGFNVTEKMIKDVFASQGFLVDVHLPLDWQTRKHAGFGYLYFASTHAAKGALEALQGIHIDGHSINLEFSDHTPITNVQAPRDNEQSSPRADPNNTNVGATPDTPELPGARQLIDDSRGSNKTSEEQAAKKSDSQVPGASNTRSESSALLDRDNVDSDFSVRYPSLIPEANRRSSRVDMATSGHLPRLSPESEMTRFPPVSQLDAHMLANQHRDTESTPSTRAFGEHVYHGESHVRQRSSRASPDRSRSHRIPEHRRHNTRLLRRSNTMMPAHPTSRLAGPFDPMAPAETHSATRELRRRATEIHTLLSNPQHNQSAASLERAYRNTPGSFPAGDERPHLDRNLRYPSTINRIDDCVSTLVSLGYGSAEEGGHQRLAVYAAAAGGKVADAIEMIEDERKVYAQRRP